VLCLHLEDVQYRRKRVVIRYRTDHPKGAHQDADRASCRSARARRTGGCQRLRMQRAAARYRQRVPVPGGRQRYTPRRAVELPGTAPHVHTAVRIAGDPRAVGDAAHAAAYPCDADVEGRHARTLHATRPGHASPESTRRDTRVSDAIVVAEYLRAIGQVEQ
jgi:hypothetical protein